jgi:hypothetical protein
MVLRDFLQAMNQCCFQAFCKEVATDKKSSAYCLPSPLQFALSHAIKPTSLQSSSTVSLPKVGTNRPPALQSQHLDEGPFLPH